MSARTTLSLDPDVVASLQRLQRRTGHTWKHVVNMTLRQGLRHVEELSQPARHCYQTPPVDPGPPRLTGVHSVYDMLAYAEGEDFR